MRLGYYADFSSPLQPVFRCDYCAFDGFEESNIKTHVSRKHPGIKREVFQPHPMVNWRVTLGLLTWNNRETSLDTAISLVREADILKQCGVYTQIAWVDNGSTDGTRTNIRNVLNENSTPYKSKLYDDNMGQSAGRNRLIDFALAHESDWLFMFDGDIALIPYSVAALLSYTIDQKDKKIGCLGLNPGNCSPSFGDPDLCNQSVRIVPDHVQANRVIAFTQYGLFNMEPIRDAIRFDMDQCFQGPGWGLEDNDFGLQLNQAGYLLLSTSMRYFHIRRSGLNGLEPTLAAKVFEARRSYMQIKWRDGHSLGRLP